MKTIVQLADLVNRSDFKLLLEEELEVAKQEAITADKDSDIFRAQGAARLLLKLMRLEETVRKVLKNG